MIFYRREREFRKSLVLYGQALTQDDQTAVQLLAEQLAQMSASPTWLSIRFKSIRPDRSCRSLNSAWE